MIINPPPGSATTGTMATSCDAKLEPFELVAVTCIDGLSNTSPSKACLTSTPEPLPGVAGMKVGVDPSPLIDEIVETRGVSDRVRIRRLNRESRPDRGPAPKGTIVEAAISASIPAQQHLAWSGDAGRRGQEPARLQLFKPRCSGQARPWRGNNLGGAAGDGGSWRRRGVKTCWVSPCLGVCEAAD